MLTTLLCALPLLGSPPPGSGAATALQDTRRHVAREDLAKAYANAEHKNRRVLLMLFSEWHGPSTNLLRVLKEDEGLAHELLYEYDLVVANLTLDPEAPAVAREHGFDPEKLDAPMLAVLDARGNVVAQAAGSTLDAAETGTTDPKKVLDFLGAHRAAPWDAEARLRDALAEAQRANRRVLIHAGAPW